MDKASDMAAKAADLDGNPYPRPPETTTLTVPPGTHTGFDPGNNLTVATQKEEPRDDAGDAVAYALRKDFDDLYAQHRRAAREVMNLRDTNAELTKAIDECVSLGVRQQEEIDLLKQDREKARQENVALRDMYADAIEKCARQASALGSAANEIARLRQLLAPKDIRTAPGLLRAIRQGNKAIVGMVTGRKP